jgi:hypothetical protein
MKWMKERDLLIAQTMAFVQSVTGKTPAAETTITASVAVLSVEASETTGVTAVLPEYIESLLAETPLPAPSPGEVSREVSSEVPVEVPVEVSSEMPREISIPAPIVRSDLQEDFRSEIRARVAHFRAHQERFNREREAYGSATMAKVRAALKEGETPIRRNK